MSDSDKLGSQEMKNKVRDSFNIVAEGYDNPALRFFSESARHLPEYLNLKGDECVLDIGTGTGHAAIAIAEALPKGSVTAIDFSEGMLGRAKAKIEEKGIRNISLHSMDMQDLDFPDGAFDAAVFPFSIFFVEDMEGALRHAMKNVKPGGRIVATTFEDGTFSPQADIFFDRIKKYGIETPAVWRRLAMPEECTSLFEKAGLGDVRVDKKDIGYYLNDAAQWWDIVWNAGLRRYVSSLSPSDLERFKAEHLKDIEGLKTDKGIWLEIKILYASGALK